MNSHTDREIESTPVLVTEIESIPPGEGRCFNVAETQIAIFRLRNGQIFALDNSCPHRGGPLGAGRVGTDSVSRLETVMCPMHAFKFALRDGTGIDNELSVRRYKVELRGTSIYVAAPREPAKPPASDFCRI
jgi:nitrite reductase (NADH) small subunit